MVCIYCGHPTKVTNSRPIARLPGTWRRRECLKCVAQFTTTETADLDKSYVVIKSSKKLAPFQRDVLFISLFEALKHRGDAESSAAALTRTIIGIIIKRRRASSSRIEPSEIAETVFKTLKRFDKFAASNYLAFHQDALRNR